MNMNNINMANLNADAREAILAAYNNERVIDTTPELALLWYRIREIAEDLKSKKIIKSIATARKEEAIAEYITAVEYKKQAETNAALVDDYRTAALLYQDCLTVNMRMLYAYEVDNPRPDINDDHATARWYDDREHWLHETRMRIDVDIEEAELLSGNSSPSRSPRKGLPEDYYMDYIEEED